MAIEIVDSHHHLWSLSVPTLTTYKWLQPVEEGGISWHIAGDVQRFKTDYLLNDYLQDVTNPSCHLVKSVHVQAEADDAVGEVRFLEEVASKNPGGFPNGIVAHANLASPKLPELLETYKREFPRVKGVRQLLNWSTEDPRLSMTDRGDYLTDPAWLEGFRLLTSHSLSFDLQVYPAQMIDAAKVARQYPDAIVILNHCGMPIGGMDNFQNWKEGMKHLAEQSNVVCKLSGLAMFQHAWSKDNYAPYILECLRLFTPKRCMFGSNFPVDKLNIKYEELINVCRDIAEHDAGLTKDELELIFKHNALKTYRL